MNWHNNCSDKILRRSILDKNFYKYFYPALLDSYLKFHIDKIDRKFILIFSKQTPTQAYTHIHTNSSMQLSECYTFTFDALPLRFEKRFFKKMSATSLIPSSLALSPDQNFDNKKDSD